MKYSKNIYSFISGIGPCSSSLITKSLQNIDEVRSVLRKNCPVIYKNIETNYLFPKI